MNFVEYNTLVMRKRALPPPLHRMLPSTIIASTDVFHQCEDVLPRYPRVWCPAGGGRDSAMAAFH